MGFSLDVSISAFTVFLQGLLSFFSPCVLPLLPMYFGYLAGGTATRDENGQMHYDRKKVMIHTLFFVIGISAAFFLLGLGMTAIGKFFGSKQYLIARIGGIIIVLFGLYQLGIFGNSKILSRERRLSFGFERMAMSPVTALLLGFVFSFAWTPCVGPALSSVLIMAASSSSGAMGFLLIGVYTLGFVLPFLAAGLFTTSLLGLFRRHRNIVRYTVKIGGALLILMGIMMLTGRMNLISGYLSKISQPRSVGVEAVTESESVVTEAVTESEPADTEAVTEQDETEEQTETAESDKPEEIPAIDFELKDQYGEVHRLSDYKGKTVFLNFWATWCPPCRAEMPDIQSLYEKYQEDEDSEVIILGVAAPDYGSELDEKGVCDFLDENGYTYPVVMDEGGKMFMSYYISSIPTTYMIDKNGNVFGYVTGSLTMEIMQSIIDQTIAGR